MTTDSDSNGHENRPRSFLDAPKTPKTSPFSAPRPSVSTDGMCFVIFSLCGKRREVLPYAADVRRDDVCETQNPTRDPIHSQVGPPHAFMRHAGSCLPARRGR